MGIPISPTEVGWEVWRVREGKRESSPPTKGKRKKVGKPFCDPIPLTAHAHARMVRHETISQLDPPTCDTFKHNSWKYILENSIGILAWKTLSWEPILEAPLAIFLENQSWKALWDLSWTSVLDTSKHILRISGGKLSWKTILQISLGNLPWTSCSEVSLRELSWKISCKSLLEISLGNISWKTLLGISLGKLSESSLWNPSCRSRLEVYLGNLFWKSLWNPCWESLLGNSLGDLSWGYL